MARIHNFNAGPAALPLPVLQRAQAEMLDYAGSGMSILEHSHRGKVYDAVHNEAMQLLRELLDISDAYEVLFLQGGASLQFAMLPMNFLAAGDSADYVMTGTWSEKALQEAQRIANARAAGGSVTTAGLQRLPRQAELSLDDEARYLHITSNNTIRGTQFHHWPNPGSAELVADMSSDILSRPLDVSRFGMVYAGAQKNVGPSGLAIVILKKSWLAQAREDLPNILRYAIHASKRSLYHTPNSFAVYMVRHVLNHLKELGGLTAVEKNNQAKATLLYDAIDGDADFYRCPVAVDSRSLMNVVFNLPTAELEAAFVAQAAAAGLNGLKGHRSVGGIRASIYNAVPLQAVEALVTFMRSFRARA
ncbi:MAG TPA: 3-phosphoserine/phosphohydroxythreonine transaminase [Sorangium sp.]|nr:3-phosphoserine/phosphohydroxythreonine transaminase [Sorangium sp.]